MMTGKRTEHVDVLCAVGLSEASGLVSRSRLYATRLGYESGIARALVLRAASRMHALCTKRRPLRSGQWCCALPMRAVMAERYAYNPQRQLAISTTGIP